MLEYFPDVFGYMKDAEDDGDYHFYAALENGNLIGGAVFDFGEMGFGPLRDVVCGYLENIEVEKEYRRKGIGSSLLRFLLEDAWNMGAESVRWTVDYDNEAGIALYRSIGAAFIPDEDPDSENPLKQYTVVVKKRVNNE